MSVKMTGFEFKTFWNDDWIEIGPDTYVEDEVIAVNGEFVDPDNFDVDQVKDGDAIRIDQGAICLSSRGFGEAADLVKFARKWMKKRNTAVVVVEVPKEVIDDFMRHVESFSSKIVIRK